MRQRNLPVRLLRSMCTTNKTLLCLSNLTHPEPNILPTERVLHLEADLRRSEETIQSLQQELALTKLAQTPTTDSHRYQLGAGSRSQGSGGNRRGSGSQGSPVHQKSVEEVAVIVTETSVAKGMYNHVQCPCTMSMYSIRSGVAYV